MFLVTVSWRTCDRHVPVGRRQTESDDTHDIDADADSNVLPFMMKTWMLREQLVLVGRGLTVSGSSHRFS